MVNKASGQMLAATAPGNPGIIARPITWDAALIGHHRLLLNTIFATIQLLLALGIAFRPTARPARPCRRAAAFPTAPATCAYISLNDSDRAACPSSARTRASSTTASRPPDTLVMRMNNYVIGVSNNVIVNRSNLRNSVSVHNIGLTLATPPNGPSSALVGWP